LEEYDSYRLKDFRLCKPNSEYKYGFSYSTICNNGVCDTDIKALRNNKRIPTSTELYRKVGNECSEKYTLSDYYNKERYTTYFARVILGKEIFDKYGVLGRQDIDFSPSKGFSGGCEFKKGYNHNIKFKYKEKVAGDMFMYGEYPIWITYK
jgi:hypothetical protein